MDDEYDGSVVKGWWGCCCVVPERRHAAQHMQHPTAPPASTSYEEGFANSTLRKVCLLVAPLGRCTYIKNRNRVPGTSYDLYMSTRTDYELPSHEYTLLFCSYLYINTGTSGAQQY